MPAFHIERGVPAPKPRKWGVFDKTVLAAMNVGDSFKLPVVGDKGAVQLPDGSTIRLSTIRSYVSSYGARAGRRFSVQRVGGEYRVWRTG